MLQIELKKLRDIKGISQQALAEALGVSQGAVGLWESGKREPNYKTLIRIADYFGVSVGFLLGTEKTQKNTPDSLSANQQTKSDGNNVKNEDERITEILSVMSSLSEDDLDKAVDFLRYLATKKQKE